MKICLVSDNLVGYHETWSGAEMVVQYLASLLKKEGQRVTFLTIRSKKKERPADIFPAPALTGSIWFFKKIIPFHVLIRTIAVFFQLRKIRPDVIHLFHSNSLFIPVMICTKILKIPTTFTVLDYWISCPTGHFLLRNGEICRGRENWQCLKCVPLIRFLERQLVKLLAKNLKYLVTFTETSKKRLIEHGFPPEKIKVKYIYQFSFNTPSGDEDKIIRDNDILFVGTFRPQKGLDIIIQAMPYVISRVPDSRLIVVGRGVGEDKERIENLVSKLDLAKKVIFLGQKEHEETLQLIKKSKMVVVAEQWFSDFGPVVLLEAMAQGRPVVTGEIGSIPEFIKDGFNGFLVDYNNPEKFSEKIIWLLEHKKEAVEMGKRAKETIQTLFSGNQDKEIFELYAKL